MLTKDEVLIKIKSLVQRFDEQKETYKNTDYNETQTRRDFIDPFWKALGWDIDNENDYAESYREVIHEDRVKVDGKTKAPDYLFRLPGGKRLFFLEAKKPSVSIKDEVEPAYQVRRYGWSAKMAISVISDFEEFAIYDCTQKPKPTDKASNGRIKYLTYKDYENEFDFIWDTFSKEKVLKGSFDKYIASDKNKKGTTTVDNDFLTSLDKWRIELAKNIALRNKNLDEDELNFLVQNTLDRIVFLRIAEDRHVERYGELQEAIKTGNYYQNLLLRFNIADQKYNSGLFDFRKDKISKEIVIDNKVIKEIITEFYYPKCPYEFSVLSVEILGSAYEQFLGKQITLSKSGRATIEEKPEVRKAGGVYYTPQYIVDYIVKNTVGKLIENKTPKEIEKIKILDPACGSGSFLIGAYQYLLNWHKDFYTQNGKQSKGKKDDLLTPTGELTTAEKKRILLNNIYGVDLDSNAVEVTKLSLLLKCMEGETKESIEAQTKLFHDRVLPTLDNNIKSGNSLIDLDFYDGQIEFSGEERKIKPFSWQNNFPEVFKNGGFDCVIGNPPYVRSKLLEDNQRNYFSGKYKSAKGTFDIYSVFIERAFFLVKENGLVAFINPNKYFYSDYGEGIRKVIVDNFCIESIVDFNEFQVFDGITTYTAINIFAKKKDNSTFLYSNISEKKIDKLKVEDFLLREIPNEKITLTKVEVKNLNNSGWVFKSENEIDFINKIESVSTPLINLCYKIYQGFVLTPTEVFPVSIEETFKTFCKVKPIKQDETIYEVENELLVPIVKSSCIFRYHIETKNYYSVFPYRYLSDSRVELVSEKELKEKYSKAYNYLKAKAEYLKTREKGKWSKSPNWYEFSRKQNFECQKMKKILVPGLATNARYTLADENVFIDQGSYGIILKEQYKQFEKYILGVLNSKLLDFILKSRSGTLSGGYYSYQTKYLSNLPIIIPKDKTVIASVEKIVNDIIDITRELSETKLQSKIDLLTSKIDYYEAKLNRIVYEIYGLKEGIEIIEKE